MQDKPCTSDPHLTSILPAPDVCPIEEAGPLQFADKPDIPFKLVGFTDLKEEQFVYFKTPGGHWVAAAQDPQVSRSLSGAAGRGDLQYARGALCGGRLRPPGVAVDLQVHDMGI